ncbi:MULTISPECIES: SA1320 family protein [unclassified Granulicatella]|uniref:SA1320 family protein n=1 Tax=unclassified Granulicatella TaxID=2630493 RepID=UPI001073FA71|nr:MULTISPECIES: Mbeg1-like protein [unclassified Granulicatella]MBF0780367.1 DUF2974 domain-containing protein [Granulicatella sp. 19428wC4_WM01]TFU95499.1 DUF2974 domain-containing protein [Granulicatella sp. WM01]
MVNNQYTDREREYIAKQQYTNHEPGSQILTLDKERNIGYVSEIKNKLSGENTYIVTDIKLPDTPTTDDLAKVGHVTLLYQGSQDVRDWTLNNVPMVVRIHAPDFVPTRPTIQLRDAAKTLQETLDKYPNANISIYGHSLGSMNAQSAISSIDEKYDHRISGVYLYNGPNIYRTLNSKQKVNAERLYYKIFNYVDIRDFIGLKYDNNRHVGQLFKVNSEYTGKGLLGFIAQHNWGGYQYDNDGNLVHANGELVSPETRIKKIDINQDGIVDLVVNNIDIRPRNLLSQNDYITSSKDIVVNTDLLNTLANNLSVRIQEDVIQMAKICQLCIEKNQKVNNDFELRKQEVSESIKDVFKSAGFPSLLHSLNNSVDVIIQQKSLLERGMEYTELRNPFLSHETPMVNGDILNTTIYNTQLATLRHVCEPLVTQIRQEKTHTISNFFMGEQTLLGSWTIIESATKYLLQKSDEIFEGEGLRHGKKDGISESLSIVLEIIHKNTEELHQGLLNVVELTQGIAEHFKQADHWLGTQLKDGQFVGEMPAPKVPSNYIAYLEEDGIFDDVKDVFQAFDRQVEQKSRQYAREVAAVYHDSIGTFEKGLERWKDLAMDLNRAISQITMNYNQSIQVKEKTIIQKQVGDKLIKEITFPIRYWGRLEQLYPSHTLDLINQIKSKIISKIDVIQQALWQSDRIKKQLHHLENQLKPIVEEGVYTSFDLEEIVQGQKTVLQLARRLSQEIGHVAHVITGEGMVSQSIDMLKHKLQDTKRLIDYYARFVEECFGDNEHSADVNTILDSTRFSLNIPLPY